MKKYKAMKEIINLVCDLCEHNVTKYEVVKRIIEIFQDETLE